MPNAVPSAEGTGYSIENIMNNIGRDLTAAARVSNSTVNRSLLDEQGIREVRLFKFEETNLRKKARVGKLEPDEEAAVAKYQLLAKVIADGYQS